MNADYRIELDVIEHDDPQFVAYLAENRISLKMIKKHGPAGCSLIRFTGSYNSIAKLIADYYFDSECTNHIEINQ